MSSGGIQPRKSHRTAVTTPDADHIALYTGDGAGGGDGDMVDVLYAKKNDTTAVVLTYTNSQAITAVGGVITDTTDVDFTVTGITSIAANTRRRVQTQISAASKAYSAADLNRWWSHVNGGADMTATMPTITAALDGYWLFTSNDDTAGKITYTAAASQFFVNASGGPGGSTFTQYYAKRTNFVAVWNGGTNPFWRIEINNNNVPTMKTGATAIGGNLVRFASDTSTGGNRIDDSGVATSTDVTLAANSDALLPTQKAVKAYADGLLAANDAMVLKGAINCAANPNYPAADAGHAYRVSGAGKIGGGAGVNVEIGDLLFCVVDGSAAGTQAAVGANWIIEQVNIDGAVTGPAASVAGRVATFNGTSGKIIQDSGLTLTGTNTGDQNDLTLPLETTGISPAYVGTATQKQFNINLNRGKVNLLNYVGASFVADAGDGTTGTDMGAVFNSIFTNIFAVNKGGCLVVPGGILMRQTTPIVLTTNGVEIDGGGCGHNADTGNFRDALGTALLWRGAAGQIMFLAQPGGSGGVGQNLKGFRMSGLSLDGRNNTSGAGDVGSVRADKGLVIRSASGWHAEDIFVQDCVTSHIELDVLAPGTIAEAHDCTRGELNRYNIRAVDGGGAGGTVAPGTGLVMNGSASANTCFNEIRNGSILYVGTNTGKPAIDMINTDSNEFGTTAINNASAQNTSNWGCVVRGGATTAASSRANSFKNFSPGSNGMIICGTALGIRPDGTADASFNFTAPANNNFVDENTENGENYVYRGTGVKAPVPGASGGSTFATQGFRCGGGTLASSGPGAAIVGAKTTILGVTVPKWFFTDGTQIEVECEGIWSWGAAATVFTGTIDVAGVAVAAFSVTTTATARTAEVVSFRGLATCTAAGVTGSMRGGLSPAFSTMDAAGGAVTTAAAETGVGAAAAVVNTTIANAINVTMTCAGATTPSFTPLSCVIRVVN